MSTSREKINPEKKPLEELAILINEDGIQKKVAAFSSHFASNRPMTPFLLPPLMNEKGTFDNGVKEEWFHKMEIFKANMQWLLGLPHHRFWSQIVYGKKTWDTVISYLQDAYPFFAIHLLPDDFGIRERYNEISYLVFCVICRVCTQKESEDAWIGKVKYSELLYDKTIISLPILFDLCVVFGNDNKDEINRIITNIFSLQPLYKDDLEASEKHLKNVLSTIEDKFLMSHIKPPDPQDAKDSKIGIADIYDVSFYIIDTIATLYSFLDAYPEGAMILHLHTFEIALVQFYDRVYPSLIKKLQDNVSIFHPSYETLIFSINQSRIYVLKLYYVIIQSSVNFIIENRCSFPEELLKFNAESFLNVIIECLRSAKIFMTDYQKLYPLEQDLDVLSQVYPEIRNDKFKSILDQLKSFTVTKPKKVNRQPTTSKTESPTHTPVNHQNGHSNTSCSNKFSEVELNSFITEVKDILPHLGEGFILECLKHYNYKSSDVINSVLEDLLPPKLQSLDRQIPVIPPEFGVSDEKNYALSQRVNVFDNDEFDIMRQDHVDTSRIHKGKRNDVKDAVELLDDKSFREELRDKFSKLGIVESMVDDVYDDEYDDTYDDRAVPVEEEGEAERKFVVPRILQQKKETRRNSKDEDEDISEDDTDQEGLQATNGFVPFVENPEVIRARREQTWASKQRGPPPPKKDVVGKPKGQGQESDTLKNRSRKATNKSSYGNHNRKKGAQFKRSQGFIPS